MAKRIRPLWIRVDFKVPPHVTKDRVIRTLIRSIERGDYKLPDGWRARIHWRNKNTAEMKNGPWAEVLIDSAESSTGFDSAMINYLEGQLAIQ